MEASDLTLRGHVDEIPDDWKSMYDDWLGDVEDGDAGMLSLTPEEILGQIMSRLPV